MGFDHLVMLKVLLGPNLVVDTPSPFNRVHLHTARHHQGLITANLQFSMRCQQRPLEYANANVSTRMLKVFLGPNSVVDAPSPLDGA